MVSSTVRPHFTPGKDPVPIVQEAGWAPGQVWTGGKSRPHRDSIPDRPACSSVAIPTELPGPYTHTHTHTHTYIYIYIYILELTRNANILRRKKGHFCLLNNFLLKDAKNLFTVEFQTEGNPPIDNSLNNASISFIVTPPTSVSAYL